MRETWHIGVNWICDVSGEYIASIVWANRLLLSPVSAGSLLGLLLKPGDVGYKLFRKVKAFFELRGVPTQNYALFTVTAVEPQIRYMKLFILQFFSPSVLLFPLLWSKYCPEQHLTCTVFHIHIHVSHVKAIHILFTRSQQWYATSGCKFRASSSCSERLVSALQKKGERANISSS
jgi:hypothetical protein